MSPKLAISNRVIYTAGFAAAGIWIALALVNWRQLVQGPDFWLPISNTYGFALLFQSHVQVLPIAGAVLLNFAAAVIGYALVVRPIWGHRLLASQIWLYFAGVVPGYLLIAGLSRILTLIAPNRIAPWLVLATVLGTVLFILASHFPGRRLRITAEKVRSVLLGIVALLSVLVFEVQFDRFHVAGEAILFVLDSVFLSPGHGIGTGAGLPLFSQHYDEASFLYPLVYGLMEPGSDARATAIMLYWITLAVGRLGAMSLTYIAFRSLGCDRLSALIAVAFVTASALSLNPLSSHILFDSLNPLGYTLHISRFVIPVLPLVVISAAAESWRTPRRSSLGLPVAALLGAGMAAMSVHVALVLAWAVAVLTLTALFPRASEVPALWRAGCAAALVVLTGFTVSYGFAFAPTSVRVMVLLGAGTLAAIILLWCWLSSLRASATRIPAVWLAATREMAALCGGYAVAFLLLGNVFVHDARRFFGSLWPWSDVPIVDRFPAQLVSPIQGLLPAPYCKEGLDWSGRLLTGHCGSLPLFARTYGLALVLATVALAWMVLRSTDTRQHSRVEVTTLVLWGILLSVVAHPVAFVLFDFVGAVSPPADWTYGRVFFTTWIRSRLIEPWFYGAIVLSLTLFLSQATQRERRWAQSGLMICVAVFALNPLLLPAQLLANLTYVLDAFAGTR